MNLIRRIRDTKATVAIVALSMIVIFSMMASSLGFRGGLEAKLVKRQLDMFRERYLTEAVVTAVQYMVDLDEEPETDSPLDTWFGEPALPESIDFGEGVSIAVKVTDEEGKVNINYASEAFFTALFDEIDADVELSTEIDELVAGIMNWRGDSAIQGGTKLGEKYKNAPFESLDELYLIKDIKPEDIPKITPYLSVYGIGAKNQAMVNPNTASLLVLKTLVLSLSGDEKSKEDVAGALVDYRDLLDTSREISEEQRGEEEITYFSAEDIKAPENIHLKLGISNVDPVMQSIVAQLLTRLTVDSKFYNVYVDIKENESSLGTKAEIVVGPPLPPAQNIAGGSSPLRPRRPMPAMAGQPGGTAALGWRDM